MQIFMCPLIKSLFAPFGLNRALGLFANPSRDAQTSRERFDSISSIVVIDISRSFNCGARRQTAIFPGSLPCSSSALRRSTGDQWLTAQDQGRDVSTPFNFQAGIHQRSTEWRNHLDFLSSTIGSTNANFVELSDRSRRSLMSRRRREI